MRFDMLFFFGYDIDQTLPWQSTLSRTRQSYEEDVYKQLCKDVLRHVLKKAW
ncbi:hypothetical protein EXU57_24315 [Segetibacter sp. 3557_3]|uniref:hypothetical protein n=1 Tax=Segetibacter sp. 3557_3 TaxID=2547429 RepID=UPI0010584493|nr:hypothetical protein [Segetibacter sp. 3557_3]TDH18177.1 hypothetical protein EXU57_24315 [Segetibacter sp. 3557_3]